MNHVQTFGSVLSGIGTVPHTVGYERPTLNSKPMPQSADQHMEITMIVYRVAYCGDIKRGLYSSWASNRMHELDGPHPGPWADARMTDELLRRGMNTAGGWWFGFKNLDQLRQWIYNKEWRAQLADEGYVCYELEVDDAIIGDCQCIFKTYTERRVVAWDEINE